MTPDPRDASLRALVRATLRAREPGAIPSFDATWTQALRRIRARRSPARRAAGVAALAATAAAVVLVIGLRDHHPDYRASDYALARALDNRVHRGTPLDALSLDVTTDLLRDLPRMPRPGLPGPSEELPL